MELTVTGNRENAAGHTTSRATLWTGRVLSGLAILFLAFDAVGKLLRFPEVVKGTTELGFDPGVIVPIGVVLLVCVLVYAVPRASVLGAVLLTGYLGGAVAVNVHAGNPLFSHVLFPIYVAVLVWGGLFLRDARARAILAAKPRG